MRRQLNIKRIKVLSEQLFEFFNRKSSISDDSCHCEGIDRIGSRDGDNALTVSHGGVLTLSNHPETGFFESCYRSPVRDAW